MISKNYKSFFIIFFSLSSPATIVDEEIFWKTKNLPTKNQNLISAHQKKITKVKYYKLNSSNEPIKIDKI